MSAGVSESGCWYRNSNGWRVKHGLTSCGRSAVDGAHFLGEFRDFGFSHTCVRGLYHLEPELGLRYGKH